MVLQAAGELHLPAQAPRVRGAAIEVRVYAEDPRKQFQPSTGTLTQVSFPEGVRCDTWVETGSEITPYYDPLLAKIVTHGSTRALALERMRVALAETRIDGVETNLEYLRQIAREPRFARGEVTTGYLQDFAYAPRTLDVIDGGTQTTVQDYPGRLGHWAVGVPPSGPIDDYAFRIANRLVGNAQDAAGLEITLSGPTLVFNCDAVIAVTGAAIAARAGAEPLATWRAVQVRTGT